MKAAGFPILFSFFQIQGQAILAGVQGRTAFPSLCSSDPYRDYDRGENRGLVLTDLLGMRMFKWFKNLGASWEVLSSTRPLCPVQYDSASLPQVLPGLSPPPTLVFSSALLMPPLNTLFLRFFAKSNCTQSSEFSLTATSSGK